ncbi:aldo/keto reductase [Sphingomonas sp. MMS12-HWE2-04]|uniref:aldo/keto reductase n=1 Tax=Sphingomonas sp. MMS12-HWE2-04 TaxID=3234199 RepID=UPI00384FCADF
MRRRRLGRTGLTLSECTLGTATLAQVDPQQARAAIARAFDRGIDAVEMRAGDGAAAALLRDAGHREIHVLARVDSLIPFDLPSPHVLAHQAYPGHHIRAQAEALLTALRVERLGVLLLPDWCPEWLEEGDWRETLQRLRDEGKIAGFGIALFDHDADAGLSAVASGAIDCVEVMVNLFDPSAAVALLPLCQKHDVGVIARSPLHYGALAARSPDWTRTLPREDWRRSYFFDAYRHETHQRVERIARGIPGVATAALALQFAQSSLAVSTVAVGMTQAAHVDANLGYFGTDPLSSAQFALLSSHKWLC